MSHKKIEKACAKKLEKDSRHYKKEMKYAIGEKKKHEKIEMKESAAAAKSMKKFAKKAHEY